MNARLPLFDHWARIALAACAVATLALAGCAVTRTSPVKQTFLLDPPAPAAVARAQPGTLHVEAVRVAAKNMVRFKIAKFDGIYDTYA